MAETATKAELADEVSELRDRIKALEEELEKERDRHEHKKDKTDAAKSMEKVNDQMTRLTRGLFFAGLEAMALSAKVTREFVDRTDERSAPHRRDTWAKMMTDLPVDAAKGLSDALENSVDDIEKVVDKFYAKYKE